MTREARATIPIPGTCRVCGCTEADACLAFDGGGGVRTAPFGLEADAVGCRWLRGTGRTLCSACVGVELPADDDHAGWAEVARGCELAIALDAGHRLRLYPPGEPAADVGRARRLLRKAIDRGVRPSPWLDLADLAEPPAEPGGEIGGDHA